MWNHSTGTLPKKFVMNTTLRRATLLGAATPLLILVGPGHAAADPPPTPAPAHPVVLLGQHSDPLNAFLTCVGTGLIPLVGPNIVFPICLA